MLKGQVAFRNMPSSFHFHLTPYCNRKTSTTFFHQLPIVATFYALFQIISNSPRIPAIAMAASSMKNPTSFTQVQPDRASHPGSSVDASWGTPGSPPSRQNRLVPSAKVRLLLINGRQELWIKALPVFPDVNCAEIHSIRSLLSRSFGVEQQVALGTGQLSHASFLGDSPGLHSCPLGSVPS